MSGPAARNLKQDVTYWAPIGTTNDFNEPAFDAPIKVKGRWSEEETIMRNANGDETIYRNAVYLLQAVAEKGYLGLGDLTGTSNPLDADEGTVFEIHGYHSTPDLRNMEQQHKAIC